MQLQGVHLDPDRFTGQFRDRSVSGEQGHLLPPPIALLHDLYGFDPGGLLAVVDLSEIKDMALDNLVIHRPMIFNDTPVAVLFPVFEASFNSQEHTANLLENGGLARGQVGTTSNFGNPIA
jgi:hypothetical protein